MKFGRPDYDQSIVDLRGLSLRQVDALWRAVNEAPPGSLGEPIPEDEPVFLIRGQDEAAPSIIGTYAHVASLCGADETLVRAAHDWAAEVRTWQREHPGRVKVADRPIEGEPKP